MNRVLVIDEDGDVACLLGEAAARAGIGLELVQEPQRALDEARAVAPDLILVDVIFTDNPVEGFDVARRIKAEPDLQGTPVVVLCDVAELAACGFRFDPEDLRHGWLPVEEFVRKPVTCWELMTLVETYL